MSIPFLYSAKRIEHQFHTGEEPVMVMCSDVNIYVCKYMRSSATACKLACELIGAQLATAWQLRTPEIAIVNIKPSHWEGINESHILSSQSIGFRWQDGVVDITPSTYAKVPATIETLNQLMKIALFDFWVANEDRNANNANLMYDMAREQLVSIDYGCIFNRSAAAEITNEMPQEWQVPAETVSKKLSQLFDDRWTAAVWDNYMECLTENIR